MKNVIHIDAINDCQCDAISAINDGTNSLHLTVLSDLTKHPKLEIGSNVITIEDNPQAIELSNTLFTGSGTFQFRIVNDEHTGSYFTVKQVNNLEGNLSIKQVDNFNYQLILTVESKANTAKTGQRELLWSGTLAKGKSVTLQNANWKKYNLFMARTSDGATVMVGMRYDSGGNASIRFIGGYDDGTNSWIFKGSTRINLTTNVLTNVSISMHKYLTSSSGTGAAKNANLVQLWGII